MAELNLHRVEAWNECRKAARPLVADNYAVLRNAMEAFQRIKAEKLYIEGGYETYDACLVDEFGMTAKLANRLDSAFQALMLPFPVGEPDGVSDGASDSDDESSAHVPRRLSSRAKTSTAAPSSQPDPAIYKAQSTFRDLGRSIGHIKDRIESLVTTEYGGCVQTSEACAHLNNASAVLRDAMPAGACGYCKSGDPCAKCHGRGWLPMMLYKHMPAELRRDGR